MTRKRSAILAGMGAGAVWAIALVWFAAPQMPQAPLADALILAGFLLGMPLLLLIARLAHRRFAEDTFIDGEPFTGPAEIDQKVLSNSLEQALLAILIWPFAGQVLGGALVLALGSGFVIARAAFWIGYHVDPALRAFGFAATFYPTALSAALAVWTILD